jgi:hypothetical protein
MSLVQRLLSITTPQTTEQTPLRGPVPLAAEWLAHVAGGQGESEAPRGRWSPIEASESVDPDAAPRGRW